MCEELIRRLTALKTCYECEISGKLCDDNCATQYEAGNMGEIVKALDDAVKVLKKRPKAEWIDDDDHLSENTECSICNFYMLKEFKKKCKYCPNCGARMRGEE